MMQWKSAAVPLEGGQSIDSGESMSIFANGPRITTFLWFESNAEEAAEFYIGIFRNSRKVSEFRSPIETPSGPAGAILTIAFELDGVAFTALNGGPGHKFNDAMSLVVHCETQEEIDYYWSKLTAGGSEIACGWLRDKFGLCWQVVPSRQIGELLKHPKGMQAMMKMKKFDIAELERAAQS
jgi:predicted 3-demethylubiquinone-9 3-methyltransferase (glyoxalase superfamily)